MAGSLLVGTFVLNLRAFRSPIRVAGGIIVAATGWRLLNQGSQKEDAAPDHIDKADYKSLAFYPLTLPLTTGPGTIAVMSASASPERHRAARWRSCSSLR